MGGSEVVLKGLAAKSRRGEGLKEWQGGNFPLVNRSVPDLSNVFRVPLAIHTRPAFLRLCDFDFSLRNIARITSPPTLCIYVYIYMYISIEEDYLFNFLEKLRIWKFLIGIRAWTKGGVRE